MKNVILQLLAVAAPFLLFAQPQKSLNAFSKISLAEKPFTVTGTFVGYNPSVDSFQFCKVVYNHLYKDDQQNHVGEVDKNGKFSITFPLNRPQEIMFLFGEELVMFYAVPGSSLDIQLDLAGFKTLAKLPYVEQLKQREPMAFAGQYAQLNKDYNAFRPILNSILSYKVHYDLIDSLDQMAYKQYRLDVMDRMLQALASFNGKNNTSSEFRQLMTQYIRYYAAEDLLRYRWMHGMVKTRRPVEKLTPEYLSFLETMPVDNEEAVITETYSNFLREYASLYKAQMLTAMTTVDNHYFIVYLRQYDTPVSTEEQQAAEMPPANRNAAQQQLVDSFNKRHSAARSELIGRLNFKHSMDSLALFVRRGVSKDLLSARITASYLNSYRTPLTENEMNKISGELTNADVQAQIARDNQRLRDVLAGKMSNATHVRTALQVSSDKFFDELMKPYKGKVVYIDFWAPWCGPCMGEMPDSKELQKELAGKDVVFLYIGISCTKQSWENTIKDKGIEGEHYFANDRDGKLLSEKFNISGIPHYVLVDKTGKVADDRAMRPSDKTKLLRKINGLLK
ncbi:MAG: TlpA family protein disulfide reductase [Niastella sp.]|nr:TlpA family protein disulfide reductase [Niastella sp.]